MKNVFKITLLLIAGITVSCNGCKDKDGATTEGSETSVPADGGYYDANGNYRQGDGTESGTNAASSSVKDADGTSKAKNNGYSAPNGTNAENNDGDMYTKNDTTPMPSGPPIK